MVIFWRPRSQRKQSPVWTRNSWICLNMGFTQLPWILRDSQNVPIFRQIQQPKFGSGTPHSPRNRHVPMATDPHCQGLPRFPRAAKGLYAPSELPSLSRRFPPSLRADHLEDTENRAISLRNDPKLLVFPDGFVNSLGGQCNAILTI